MSNRLETRFLQRLDSYSRAFARLDELVVMLSDGNYVRLFSNEETGMQREIISEALIKRFEFTQELSWNLLKDFLCYQGETEIAGSRDSYRKALRVGLIDSPVWVDMISDRILSAHDYNDVKSKQICRRIIMDYHPLFRQLLESMRSRALEIDNTSVVE